MCLFSCGWLHSEYIHFCLCMYAQTHLYVCIPIPLHLLVCPSACVCVEVWACGRVLYMCSIVPHLFIYHLRAKLSMTTTGVLTGRSHSMPESVSQH